MHRKNVFRAVGDGDGCLVAGAEGEREEMWKVAVCRMDKWHVRGKGAKK